MTGQRMALMALVACALAGPARAELVCAEAVHVAGQVKSGKSLTHAFTVVNRGTTPAELEEVKPGCGCLRPEVSAVVLAPGEAMKLTVHVNTVTQPAGTNHWRTNVLYRQGSQTRVLPLTVRAEVVPVVQIQPATVLLHARGPISHELKVLDRREQPFQATRLLCGSSHVRARLGPPRREAGAWTRVLTLDVLASCPEGRHDDVLRIVTTDSEYPELQVPFTVLKKTPGQVEASPAAVELTAVPGQALPSKIVLLTAEGESVRASRVETSHPCIQCNHAAGPGDRMTLRVVIDGSQITTEDFQGEVRVHLTGDKPRVVSIPVRVRR